MLALVVPFARVQRFKSSTVQQKTGGGGPLPVFSVSIDSRRVSAGQVRKYEKQKTYASGLRLLATRDQETLKDSPFEE